LPLEEGVLQWSYKNSNSRRDISIYSYYVFGT